MLPLTAFPRTVANTRHAGGLCTVYAYPVRTARLRHSLAACQHRRGPAEGTVAAQVAAQRVELGRRERGREEYEAHRTLQPLHLMRTVYSVNNYSHCLPYGIRESSARGEHTRRNTQRACVRVRYSLRPRVGALHLHVVQAPNTARTRAVLHTVEREQRAQRRRHAR